MLRGMGEHAFASSYTCRTIPRWVLNVVVCRVSALL